MTLTADTTRCHDETCQSRERCLRWVERDTGNSHAASLRKPGGYCLSYIHPGRAESTIKVPDYINPEHADTYRRGYLEGWIAAANKFAVEQEEDEE